MDTPNNRYVSFKLTDWNGDIATELGADNVRRIFNKHRLEDAVVIRGHDIFAAPTFFNYANQVVTVKEIMAASFEETTPELVRVLEDLDSIADHFHQLAMWAQELEVKLPDL